MELFLSILVLMCCLKCSRLHTKHVLCCEVSLKCININWYYQGKRPEYCKEILVIYTRNNNECLLPTILLMIHPFGKMYTLYLVTCHIHIIDVR